MLIKLEELWGSRTPVAANGSDRARPLSYAKVEDSSWEPDGVTLQVRFCEEPGTNQCADLPCTGKEPAYSPIKLS